MRVGIHDDAAAHLFGQAQVVIVQVEALGRGIVLHGDAELGSALEYRGQVDGEGLAAQQQAAGGMAEDADVRVLDGAQDARCHLLAGLVKAGVNAGDDDVELGEHFIIEVEGAVGEDVDFDAGEDADAAFHRAVDRAHLLDLREGALFVETVGHGRGSWSGR